MAKILKNTTGSIIAVDSLGIDIPASGQVTIATQDYNILGSADVITDLTTVIGSGDVVVNDGTKDLSPTVGLDHISISDHFSEENVIFAKQDSLYIGNDPRAFADNMLVYTYSTTSGYTDVSAKAKSTSGSLFQFPLTSVNNAIYVSIDLQENGDYVKPQGIEFDCTTAYYTGYINAEYWGGWWGTVPVMQTETSGDFLPTSTDHFLDTGVHSLRFEQYSVNAMVKTDPMSTGTNRYWLRFRVSSTINVVPKFEYMHAIPSCVKVNKSGFTEYFGYSRPVKTIPVSFKSLDAAYATPGNDPTNNNLYFGQNFGVGRTLNQFVNGVKDKKTMVVFLPPDLDTSMPAQLKLHTVGDSGTTGNVKYNVYFTDSRVGESLYSTHGASPASAPRQITESFTDSYTTANKIVEVDVELDLEHLVPRASMRNDSTNLLWITVERDGAHASDTYTGDVSVLEMYLSYTAWSNGAPI